MSFYIGVAKCCGNVTAALVDDERTTVREVGTFTKDLLTRGREVKRVDTLDGLRIARCRCEIDARAKALEALQIAHQTPLQNAIAALGAK